MFKKIFLVMVLIFGLTGPSHAAFTTWTFNGLTGGTAALDGRNVASLEDGHLALGYSGTTYYVYKYDASSAAAESSPTVIIPNDNATGTGAWIQINVGTGDVTLTGEQTLTNKTLTSPVINTPSGITTGDLTESTDKKYVTDAQQVILGNTSGTNSGDNAANSTYTIGSATQAYDADLTTYAGITPSANVQSFLGAATYAAMLELLDLEAGTDFYSTSATDTLLSGKQDADDDLTDLADGTLSGSKLGTPSNSKGALPTTSGITDGYVPKKQTDGSVAWEADSTGAGGDQLVDVVATTPLLVNGTTNVNDALPGSDADITFSMPAATNLVAGHMTAANVVKIEANDTDTKIVDRIKDENITWSGTHGFGSATFTAVTLPTSSVNNAAMADDAIGIAELSATGTASSSTYLRGDNSWGTPSSSAETNNLESVTTGILTGEIPIGTGSGTVAYGTDLPTATTIGSAYVYRAGGTDVADADIVAEIARDTEVAAAVDAIVYTKCVTINAATATSDFMVEAFSQAITITQVSLNQLGATNVIGQFQECDSAGGTCSAVDTTDLTATTTKATDASPTNAGIDAGDVISWATTSVSGTNTQMMACFEYTID